VLHEAPSGVAVERGLCRAEPCTVAQLSRSESCAARVCNRRRYRRHRRQFQGTWINLDYEHKLTGQPRLNVVFEAGITCALLSKSMILLDEGEAQAFTDISGLDTIRIEWPPGAEERAGM
jgi:hypothetical protein